MNKLNQHDQHNVDCQYLEVRQQHSLHKVVYQFLRVFIPKSLQLRFQVNVVYALGCPLADQWPRGPVLEQWRPVVPGRSPSCRGHL